MFMWIARTSLPPLTTNRMVPSGPPKAMLVPPGKLPMLSPWAFLMAPLFLMRYVRMTSP